MKKRIIPFIIMLSVLICSFSFTALAFGVNPTYTDFDMGGFIPNGISVCNFSCFDKVVNKGFDSQIYATKHTTDSKYTVLILVGADITKIVPKLVLVGYDNHEIWDKYGKVRITGAYTGLFFWCILWNGKFCAVGDSDNSGVMSNKDSTKGGIDDSNEYELFVMTAIGNGAYTNLTISQIVQSDYANRDFFNSGLYGDLEKINAYLVAGTTPTPIGTDQGDTEVANIMARWEPCVNILLPTDGFSQSQINTMNVRFGYKVPWKSGTSVGDLKFAVIGFTSGTGSTTESEFSIKDGYICGLMNVVGDIPYAQNVAIKVSVTDAFGKVFTDEVKCNAYSDFIDSNADGLDDRAGDDKWNRYPAGGNGAPDVASADLGGIASGIKSFFVSLYGIIPEQLYIVIIGGIILLISVGILRVVL